MARHSLAAPYDTRRLVPVGLALGATLLGAAGPGLHATTTGTAAHPGSTARVAALPPAVPARTDGGATEAISDIWGRGSGAPPRGV